MVSNEEIKFSIPLPNQDLPLIDRYPTSPSPILDYIFIFSSKMEWCHEMMTRRASSNPSNCLRLKESLLIDGSSVLFSLENRHSKHKRCQAAALYQSRPLPLKLGFQIMCGVDLGYQVISTRSQGIHRCCIHKRSCDGKFRTLHSRDEIIAKNILYLWKQVFRAEGFCFNLLSV